MEEPLRHSTKCQWETSFIQAEIGNKTPERIYVDKFLGALHKYNGEKYVGKRFYIKEGAYLESRTMYWCGIQGAVHSTSTIPKHNRSLKLRSLSSSAHGDSPLVSQFNFVASLKILYATRALHWQCSSFIL